MSQIQDPQPLFCLCRGQRSWSTSGSRTTSGPPPSAGPSSGSGPLYWRPKRFDIRLLLMFSSPVLTKVCVYPQKRPLQTDGWPEMDELKQGGRIDEQDAQQAKSVILNWIKDLRAQPEVADVLERVCNLLLLHTGLLNRCVLLSAKRLARRTCCKGSGGPAVGVALEPCAQSAGGHGDSHVGPHCAAAR